MIKIWYKKTENGDLMALEYDTFKEAVAGIDWEKDYGWEPELIQDCDTITETTLRRWAAHG